MFISTIYLPIYFVRHFQKLSMIFFEFIEVETLILYFFIKFILDLI